MEGQHFCDKWKIIGFEGIGTWPPIYHNLFRARFKKWLYIYINARMPSNANRREGLSIAPHKLYKTITQKKLYVARQDRGVDYL